MNQKTIQNELQKIWDFISNKMDSKITIIISIILIIVLILILRHIRIRSQYSKDAWKIVKKNGRKAIFWYDQYGNKTYKKPKFDPNGPKPPRKQKY